MSRSLVQVQSCQQWVGSSAVERYTVNVWVGGSIPPPPANTNIMIGNCNYQSYGDYCDPKYCHCKQGTWNIDNIQTTNMNSTPLSAEEQKQHQDFVYQAVMGNVVLQSSAKFGRDINLTIQEIVHSNVATLRKTGQQIERVAKEAGSSEFSEEGPFKINGIEASRWIDWLKLHIRVKEGLEEAADKRRKLKELKAQLEEFKTPGEKRDEIEKAIAALEGVGTPVVA